MDYILSGNGFSYNPIRDYIKIGGEYYNWESLNDDELDQIISDSLIHEHIHRAINRATGSVVACILFDIIEHKFCDFKLKLKWLGNKSYAYKFLIEKYGLQSFYNHYMITRQDVNIARFKCNTRDLNVE